MLCTKGVALIRGYQEATKYRAEMRDRVLASPHRTKDEEDPLFLAKKKYDQAFVSWVAHRSFCSSCRTFYGQDDRAQFASV